MSGLSSQPKARRPSENRVGYRCRNDRLYIANVRRYAVCNALCQRSGCFADPAAFPTEIRYNIVWICRANVLLRDAAESRSDADWARRLLWASVRAVVAGQARRREIDYRAGSGDRGEVRRPDSAGQSAASRSGSGHPAEIEANPGSTGMCHPELDSLPSHKDVYCGKGRHLAICHFERSEESVFTRRAALTRCNTDASRSFVRT